MTQIKDRRTIRKFKPSAVEEELLQSLLTTASRAATMGNMQLYSVVVTKDLIMKERLQPLHFSQPASNAPVLLTFCADFHRFCQWCTYRNATPGYNNILSFMNAMSDTLLFTQNFCTLAEDAGLGTCYLGTTLYNAKEIIELLQLPKLTFPIATISVGWPDEQPLQPDRLPLNGIIHQEKYHTYTQDSIDAIYSYKESLEENLNFIKLNGKENLAQVFTDCRYTQKDNEAISSKLIETLKLQGFLS